MRSDMHKVIVERERVRALLRYHDVRFQRRRIPELDEPDEIPRREGMRRPYGWDSKCLNENLSPLRRFLRRQIGRPWNKVYAEICANLEATNPVQQHVRDHLDDFVFQQVIIKDGQYYALLRAGFHRFLFKGEMFVSKAGILCELTRTLPPRVRSRRTPKGR